MMPILLTFGWFPLFFVFMALFLRRCRHAATLKASELPDGRRLVTVGREAKSLFTLAATLPPTLAFLSSGLYVLFVYGLAAAGIALLVVGLALGVVAYVWSRSLHSDASFDDTTWCVHRGRSASERECRRWKEISVFGFDSFTFSYFGLAASAESNRTTKLRVSAFAQGIADFEAQARASLGEARVGSAIATAQRLRARAASRS